MLTCMIIAGQIFLSSPEAIATFSRGVETKVYVSDSSSGPNLVVRGTDLSAYMGDYTIKEAYEALTRCKEVDDA